MYKEYVANSLFYIQNLYTGSGEKTIYSMKYSEILDIVKHPNQKEEDPSDIINRVKIKADNIRGKKNECI